MENGQKHPDMAAVGVMNFLCAMFVTCFCACAGLAGHQEAPAFRREALDMVLTGALFALPYLFMPVLLRYFTTRFSSRNTVTFSQLAGVILMGAGALLFLPGNGRIGASGTILLLFLVMLTGMDYAAYRSALRIYIAETVAKSRLPLAGAVTESTTFAGIVAGIAGAGIASGLEFSRGMAGAFLTVVASLSLSVATRLAPTLAPSPKLRFSGLPKTWLAVIRKEEHGRELLLTGIGESYVFGAIIFAAALAIEYVVSTPGHSSMETLREYAVATAPLAGACCGAVIGARLCRSNAEIGLVPPAALMMTLSTFLMGLLPRIGDDIIEGGLLGILLLIFGFFAGIALVPLQSYQKYFVRKELRSAFFSWFYLPFGLVLLTAVGLSFLIYRFRVPIFPVALGFSALTLVVGVVSFLLMPQFLLRFCIRMLLLTFYRLKVWNGERIPEEGPALLIANRASFVDMLFVSACTSRPVRFMMDSGYYNALPVLRPLLKAVGLVEVPNGKPKKMLRFFRRSRKLFRSGELVCAFPESDITRNGAMSGFKDNLSILLPKELDIPIIPVHIGMTWGSIFSCYRGKFKFRRLSATPHPASVTVGNPIPRNSNAYEIRVALSELAAETELIPRPGEKPFHAQILFLGSRFPRRCVTGELRDGVFRLPGAAEIAVESIKISRFLRRICHADEEYMGIMLPNSVDAVTAFTGIQLTDRTPAMLNWTASRESIRSAVNTAGIRHIITSKAFVEKQKLPIMPEMIFIEDIRRRYGGHLVSLFWHGALRFVSHRELMRLLSPASWDDVNKVAVLIFSSGSTGNPKGIMLTHHNIIGDVSAVIKTTDWHRDDRILGNLPLFHSFGMNTCLWLPVLTGARVVMIPNALDAKAAGKVLREQQITVLMTTPGFLQIYMRGCHAEDFRSIRLTVAGAEKLRSDIADKYYEMTGLVIAEGFGCTELSPIVSINVPASLADLGVKVAKRGSIGPPLTGVCVKIVDPETFEMKPENEDGLLIVKGAIVMKGYLNDPEKTAQVIRDNWYITGDIGHMDRNGFITLTGRFSRFSKIAGEMVPHELVEQEINAILSADRRVIAVGGAADARRGEKLLVFYCDDKLVNPGAVVKQLRERKVPNLWIPHADNFFKVDALPMLGSGKPDLRKLDEMSRKYDDPAV